MPRPLAALFVLLLAAACAGEPQAVEGGIDLVPAFPADPEGDGRIEFGRVGRRGTAAISVGLRNSSDRTQVARLHIAGDGSFHVPHRLELPAGKTTHFAVVLRPRALGPAAGRLNIELEEAPPFSLALAGEVVAACTSASELHLDDMPEGCGSDNAVTRVENGCDHPIQLLAIGGASSDFLVASQPLLPRRLDAGESLPLAVKHTPRSAGLSEAELIVEDDAGADLRIPLVASSWERAWAGDVTWQGERADADRLYIVDDSPAMAAHAEALAAWAEAVDEDVVAIDARIGVTTTSRIETPGCATPAADGRLVPIDGSRVRILDRPELVEGRLADRLALPFCSEAPNEAFAAAERAVRLTALRDDPDHAEPNDGNLGLRRENVPLQVVFVAASDDRSGDLSHWLRRFAELQTYANISLSAILTGAACEPVPSNHRIALLVRTLGGTVHRLCGEAQGGPWDAVHSETPFLTRFELSASPFDRDGDGAVTEAADGFALEFDGVHVPQAMAGGRLRYRVLPHAAAVEFDPHFAPGEGQRVAFNYLPVCW